MFPTLLSTEIQINFFNSLNLIIKLIIMPEHLILILLTKELVRYQNRHGLQELSRVIPFIHPLGIAICSFCQPRLHSLHIASRNHPLKHSSCEVRTLSTMIQCFGLGATGTQRTTRQQHCVVSVGRSAKPNRGGSRGPSGRQSRDGKMTINPQTLRY